jgi:XTP/dITP diphosphohydrolase
MHFYIFASHNKHKVRELNAIIGEQFQLLSLSDLNFEDEIPEPHPTLEENAIEKARTLHWIYPNHAIIAEDTGLEVEALNNEPGVKTARYANTGETADNIQLLLDNMQNCSNRNAQFRTVIALIWHGTEYFFEGIAEGTIATQITGTQGFGYDPVFIPKGYDQTYAEMSDELKNTISHRRKAADKLAHFLQEHQ